jgi:hypothetical protein
MKTKTFLSLVSAGSICFGQAFIARGVDVEAGAAVQAAPPAQVTAAPQDQAPAPSAGVSANASVRLPYGVEDVLKLARNQVSDDVIVAYVQGSSTIYNLSPNDIVYLRQQGISDRVVGAMLDHRQRMIASSQAAAAQQASQSAAAAQQAQADAAAAQQAQTGSTAEYADGSSTYIIPSQGYSYPYYGYSYPYYGSYYGGYYPYYWGPTIGFGFHGSHYHFYGGHGFTAVHGGFHTGGSFHTGGGFHSGGGFHASGGGGSHGGHH